ncbi:hypothetical protein KIPB_015298, partial [Kipferlia bialata]|eukprot:g15298.t1
MESPEGGQRKRQPCASCDTMMSGWSTPCTACGRYFCDDHPVKLCEECDTVY